MLNMLNFLSLNATNRTYI